MQLLNHLVAILLLNLAALGLVLSMFDQLSHYVVLGALLVYCGSDFRENVLQLMGEDPLRFIDVRGDLLFNALHELSVLNISLHEFHNVLMAVDIVDNDAVGFLDPLKHQKSKQLTQAGQLHQPSQHQ